MQDVIWRGTIAEEEVLAAVQAVDSVLDRLRNSGEIAQ